MKKVSVIVPVYNTEKYLRKCLDSLVNQTLSDIEIIIVNDGSTDNSLDIIEEYAHKYKDKIIYRSIPNSGSPSEPRNVALKLASGEYVGFVDSDDFIELDMFEKLYNYSEENDLDITECFYNYKIYFLKIKTKIYRYDFINMYQNKEAMVFMLPTLTDRLYKRSLFEGVSFPKNIQYEDLAIIPKVLLKSKKIGQLNDYLYNYNFRLNSIIVTSSFNVNFRVAEILLALEILNDSFSREEYKKFYDEIVGLNLYHTFWRLIYVAISLKLSRNKKIKIVNLFFNYLDLSFPHWENNKYYEDSLGIKGISKLLFFKCKKYSNIELRNYKDKKLIIKKIKELLV